MTLIAPTGMVNDAEDCARDDDGHGHIRIVVRTLTIEMVPVMLELDDDGHGNMIITFLFSDHCCFFDFVSLVQV